MHRHQDRQLLWSLWRRQVIPAMQSIYHVPNRVDDT